MRHFLRASLCALALVLPLRAQTPKQLAQLDTLNKQLAATKASLSLAASSSASFSSAISQASTSLAKAQQMLTALTTVAPPVVTPPPVIPPPPPKDTTKPPVVTPPSGGGSASCPNEPAGYTVINDNALKDIPAWPAKSSTGWIDDERNAKTAISIVNDPTAPASPNVAAGLFPGGMTGGGAPFYVYRPFAATEQFKNLYICGFVKHDAAFDNTNGNAGTKFMWPAGDQVQGALTYMNHDGSGMDFTVNQQGAVDRMLFGNLNRAAAQMYSKRGQWVRYEVLLKANSSNSAANGELHVWMNGTKTHQYTDVNWQMASARTWLSLAWNPTYGGGPNRVPRDQRQYLDQLRISGSNK